MYSPYYYSIPFTRMLTTMTVFIDSSAIAYVVQSVMRKNLLVDLHENLISLLVPGAYYSKEGATVKQQKINGPLLRMKFIQP